MFLDGLLAIFLLFNAIIVLGEIGLAISQWFRD